ncbi:MAG TPA: deoxyguanosinetriphosphate triphosphohydrolase [Clostridiales bacterium]|nr:deoxyguanosinetriphosphate triphosphohydrolase [Clostridiales bacterium]
MTVREKSQLLERQNLCRYASFSDESNVRERLEEECPMRTCFQRDRDRIIYSKAFRRLKNKTQVFFSPEGDHYITRLTHTLDVAQVARSISRVLSLNEDLAEAIALGHDLGHTPFGHAGERTLDKISGHFEHNEQSIRVVEKLENDGKGLNLTQKVKDGILHHKKSGNPATLEGQAVSMADRIAYLNHDIDDAIRAGVITEKDLPEDAFRLGKTSSERINAMILAIYEQSVNKDKLAMTKEVSLATENVRNFMFEKVYLNSLAKKEEDRTLRMIDALYGYFKSNPDAMPELYKNFYKQGESLDVCICDYISSMTDRYAV